MILRRNLLHLKNYNRMGINNLSQLINKDLYEEVPFETFAQKKIAVDAPYIMFSYNISYGPNIIKAYINFLTRLRVHNIHPIFIFDGKHPPEKLLETKKRKGIKATLLLQIQKLENDLNQYDEDCALACSQTHIDGDADSLLSLDDLKNVQPSEFLQKTYETKIMSEGSLIPIFNSELMRDYIGKLKQRTFSLKEHDINLCKDILNLFKIPFDHAPGEAEIYCAKLCKESHVNAVLSADTDVMAAGCPVILRKITSSGFKGIFLNNILDDLCLTQSQWLDLCILCGTDFNKNIPLIGPKKALQLIKTYKRLEDLPLDTSILNFIRVRELYFTEHLTLQRSYNFIPYLDKQETNEALRKYNLTYLFNNIKPLLK